jgi:hypothetical protein
VARNRAKPKRTAAHAPRNSGKKSRALTGATSVLPGGDVVFKMSVWDGSKHVEVDPEDFLRSQGMVRISVGDATPKQIEWAKRAGKLEPSKRTRIESSIISTLKQVESVEERQSIFNSVAADLGLAGPQPQEETAETPINEPSALLPCEAPEIYRERSDPAETAEQFLRRTYEPWLSAGCLFQFHVGKLDPSLLQGLKNQFKGRAEELRAILPTKTDAVNQRLAALVGKEIDDPAQRRLLAQAERSMSYAIAKLKR